MQQTPVILEKMLEVGRAKKPLSLKLSIAAFVLSMSVTTIVGYIFYSQSTELVNQSAKQYLAEKNDNIKTVIAAIYQEARDHAIFFRNLPSLQRLVVKSDSQPQAEISNERKKVEQVAENLLKTRIIYTGIQYIDLKSKQSLFSVVKNSNEIYFVEPDNLLPFDTKPYERQLSNYKSNTILFSNVHPRSSLNQRNGEYNIFNVAIPTFLNGIKKPVGLILIEVNFHRFMQLVERLSLQNADLVLLDGRNNLLFSSNRIISDKDELSSIVEQFQRMKIDNVSNSIVRSGRREGDSKEQILSAFQTYKDENFGEGHLFKWRIQPHSNQLMQGIRKEENRSLLISIGLGIFALLISFFGAKRMVSPLTQMIDALSAIEKGKDTVALPINQSDETGVLARSFYNMQIMQRFKDKQVEEHQYALDQHAIVSATDVKGNILFANSKFSEISGYSREELVGNNHRILNSNTHDNDFFRRLYKTICSGRVWHGEICNRKKNGNIYWVDTTIVPLLGPNGKPYQYVSIRTDISEIKRAEEQLVEAKTEAERAVHSKSRFFASMSHEIRTPMNGVLGMLGLMMRTDLNKQQKHYATLARSSADTLLAIIDDILDLSKIEAGKIELEIIDFNLREQLGVFAESMAYRAQDKGIEIVLDVMEIEDSMVAGDPSRLQQILSNLVGNSIKFTESGEISIAAKLVPFNAQEWIFHCSVSDTGIGIPADKIDGLFDSYSQVDASTTRKFGGTGLGLAIIKQLCELMNGEVNVSSVFGEGTEFTFEIRLGKSKQSKVVLPKQDIHGVNILVVDDNESNLQVLIRQLEHWGATTISAQSGQQALSILQSEYQQHKQTFDIAILDMDMPDMDGAELGQLIRENENYESLKLVMMTSMSGSSDISKFKDIGFSAYFPKPATTSDFFLSLQVISDDNLILEGMEGLLSRNSANQMASNLFKDAYVLLVEDNQVNQEVAAGILDDMGIKVDIAENGQQAIERLMNHNNHYGLVIMDCQMPIMDGYQATKAIRSRQFSILDCDIPVIAMTANALKGDREKCLNAGMNDYLTKPVDPNELEEKLLNWLPDEQKLVDRKERLIQNVKQKANSEDYDQAIESNDTRIDITSEKKHEEEHIMDSASEIWDREKLLARVRNNEKLAGKLINLFVTDLPNLFEELQSKIAADDYEQCTAIAHRIKGSAANLSADQVSSTAAKIEFASREEELDKVKELMNDFESQVKELLEVLERNS